MERTDNSQAQCLEEPGNTLVLVYVRELNKAMAAWLDEELHQ